MFDTTFNHGTIRKYVIYFGTIFNNIYLNRYNSDGSLLQNMRVPLSYGPREKVLSRLEGNPDLNREIAIQLPRMSFELTNMYYDASRALGSISRITAPVTSNSNVKAFQYSPVPYNFDFQLSIMVKNAEDGTFIFEQILPYFTPEWTATLNLNPDLNLKYDVPVILDSITSEDTYAGDYTQRRALIWTLNFTMKGVFFGPTKTGKIIKEVDLNIIQPPQSVSLADAGPNNTDPSTSMVITPGQYANGSSADWYGSSAASIRPNTVAANTVAIDSTFGFMVDFTENY